MKKPLLKITPVGGVGQIGSNMTLIQSSKDTIIIDAGILFPYEDFFDINYLIPDLKDVPTPSHLIITHGHEDHIGAVVDIIKVFPQITIIATAFSANLIKKKFEFNRITHKVIQFTSAEQLGFHDFTIDPIHVNHSIPETVGLLIRDHAESFGLFFTSDFKIDFNTPYERPFDFEKLKRLSKNLNKRILLCDSTNIMSSNMLTPSENDIIPVFDEIFKETTGRIFITSFASNIHRLLTIIAQCKKHNRKLVPHGRAMIGYLNTANELGMIQEFDQVIRQSESITDSQENIVVLLTGCQGDFRGTFRRFCMGEDSQFKPKKSDTIILSSKAIPGNEKKISLLINKLSEVDCKIITSQEKLVHVSGHPGRHDLLKLYEEYQPHDIVPIHGESYFIREHVKFINQSFPQAQAHYILNNDEIEIHTDLKITVTDGPIIEPILIHGKGLEIQKNKISERRKLACNGAIFMSIRLSSTKSKVESFDYNYIGLPDLITENDDKFKKFINHYFIKINFKDIEKTNEELRIAVRKYFDQILGYKPMTTIHIL